MSHEEVNIDLSFLDGINTSDNSFKRDVINIFLTNATLEVARLRDYVYDESADWDIIYKQAHLLKSSFSVVKINNITELLQEIQIRARKEQSRTEIKNITDELVAKFNKALPYLNAEKDKLDN